MSMTANQLPTGGGTSLFGGIGGTQSANPQGPALGNPIGGG